MSKRDQTPPSEAIVQSKIADPKRLDALRRIALLDTPREESFDRLTRLGAKLIDVPATFVSLVDQNRDFYKSAFGFGEPLASARQLEGRTFCHYAIASEGPLVLDDVTKELVFRDVPTVQSLGVRAYVGIPLVTKDGQVIGSFCAIDFKPKHWTERDIEILSDLARSTMREIELRTLIQESESANLRLVANERHTRTIIESAHDAFVAITGEGRIIDWNRQAKETFGWTRQEAIDQQLENLIIPPRYRDAHLAGMKHFILSGEGPILNKRIELVALRKGGAEFPVELTISPIKTSSGDIEFCAFLHDITERKQMEESMLHMAQIDQLTELPNRRLFNDRLTSAMARAQRAKQLMALIYLDIDHFKAINDSLGHGVGDDILREFASRLKTSVRMVDTVARLGGDEFVMILEQLNEPADAKIITDKIMANVRRPIAIKGRVLNITTSVGGAFYSGEDWSPDELISFSDKALYKAKQAGRNQGFWAQHPSPTS